MNFTNFKIIANIDTHSKELFLATSEEIIHCEQQLNVQFENDYKQYVLTYGRGILGGTYIRIYPPSVILEQIKEWRERINEYWFWDNGADILTKSQALGSLLIGDTLDGDEIIYFEKSYYILPRHSGIIYKPAQNLGDTIEWLSSSGVLTEAFSERDFEPFN